MAAEVGRPIPAAEVHERDMADPEYRAAWAAEGVDPDDGMYEVPGSRLRELTSEIAYLKQRNAELTGEIVTGRQAPPSEREARQAARSLTVEEVAFPVVEITEMPGRFGIRLIFGNQQDLRMFHRWLVKDGGWASFGTWIDERRG